MGIFFKIAITKLSIILKAILIGFFFIGQFYAQTLQNNLQKLEQQYNSQSLKQEEELEILSQLSAKSINPDKIIKYSSILIEKAEKAGSKKYLIIGNLQKGNGYSFKRKLSQALEFYQIASIIAKDNGEISSLALTNIAIAGVYSDIGNHEVSIKYYDNGITQLRQLISESKDASEKENLEKNLGAALLNCGDEYFKAGKYEKALNYFFRSSELCEELDYKLCSGYNLGNIGMVYTRQNKPEMAKENLNKAIEILSEEGDNYPIPVYLNYLSKVYVLLGQIEIAEDYAKQSLELGSINKSKEQILEAHFQLAEIYEKIDQPVKSLYHYKNYILNKDSINTKETLKKLANQRTEFEVSQKQVELDLEKQKRENDKILKYLLLGGMTAVSGLAFGLFRRNNFINKTKKIINQEKDKTDMLLLNILPLDTANELKLNGKVVPKRHEKVTVLFTDFKDFTKHAQDLPPEKLVETVDIYFSEFDNITKKYNLEKIKTIGDSYMCAGGLPIEKEDHPLDIAHAAIEMLDFVVKMKDAQLPGEVRFDVRIGIHTGPVVAGIVGQNKFSYDIWGDTVNIASRMESHCEAGKINVSESTYQYLKNDFLFENRGGIDVKNKGKVNMFYMSRPTKS